MNPLLNRLFEDRSKNKSRKKSLIREDQNHSVDATLVPKIPVKLRLQSLPQMQTDKKNVNAARVYIGKLPSISLKTQEKDIDKNRTSFRGRKLSTSIKQNEGNFFSTELELAYNPTFEDEMTQQSPTRRVKNETVQEKQVVAQREPTEDELFQYLKVLEDNQDLNEQFCYMNRGDLPYSFYIVEYESRKKEEYLTVSLRGISHYKQDQNEFYTVRKLRKEIELYKRVKKIDFFRHYLASKIMQHWKDCMLRTKFNMKCKYIITHLFSQNTILQQYLHFLHNLAQDYAGGNFFNFKFTATQTLQQFAAEADQGSKGLLKSIKKFDHLVEKTLKSTLQNLLAKFRAEERVTLGTGEEKRQQAYLPFDTKRRSMKYTQMAKLKQFQGMMYRLIKYTDLVTFNVKIDLVRKCYENSIAQLRNLKMSYQNKDSMRFTNWIEVQLSIRNENGLGVIVCQPSFEQISESVISIKDNFLKSMFRDHRLLIDKRTQFFCENIQQSLQEEHPTKLELKYFIVKNSEFEELNSRFEQSLQSIISDILRHIDSYRQGMLAIYNKNMKYSKASDCMSNQTIKQYFASYRDEQKLIRESQEVVQFALAVLNISQMKEVIRKTTEQKYKLISNYVPTEVTNRCEVLYSHCFFVFSTLRENPYSIEEYILFEKNFRECKSKLILIESLLQELLQFEDVVYRNGIRIGEQAKLAINQKQFFFQGLTKRSQQLEAAEEDQRKKFQLAVQQIIPVIQTKSEELLKQLFEDKLINSPSSPILEVKQKLKAFGESFSKLQSKAADLFRYQDELKMGHKILQMYDKLKRSIVSFNKIWEQREYYFKIQNLIKITGYGHMNEVVIEPLLEFVNNMQSYSSTLECFELLQEFKQQISKLLKIVKLSQLISTNTLQEQHISRLKKIIVPAPHSFFVDYLFSKEGRNLITCERLYLETNVHEIQYQINEIVFQSAQESIVKVQIAQVQQFWRKTKIRLVSQDIAQNEVPILHLDFNQQFHQKLGYFMIKLKNIEGSPHIMQASRDKAIFNIKICTYLRDLLSKWEEVEREWIKLLPLMTNCPAVKHQSNTFFEFTSVDLNLRKVIKQVSQMSSLKKLCQDVEDRKYFNTVYNCAEELTAINKTFNHFLQNKRATYGRFHFLSDFELINIIEYVRDAKSASRFAKYCFNCQQLQLDNQLMAGFQTPSELFKLRKAIIRGQIDEIFKSIEENMKNSMKFMIRAMLPKLKISQDIDQEIKEYPAQVTLVVDRLFWTEMSENYLNTTTYDEYKLVLKKIEEDMIQLLLTIQKGLWYKLSIRLMQMIALKEVGYELVRDQITVTDFKWKEQLRFYPYEQDITICQFDSKIRYGCEYYPPAHINVPTLNTTRFIYESFYCCANNKGLIVKGDEGEGKKILIYEAGVFFGSYQKKVVCNSKLSAHFVNKFVQGALAAGAWLSFYEFDSLSFSVCAQLLDLVSRANSLDNPLQSLFLLVHHGREVPQISIYSFNNFTVFQPDHEKICFHLLQVYKFKEYSQLSIKLVRFFKLIRPFLDRIMGSRLCLLRKVIQKAGHKRLQSQVGVNENLLIAQAIKEQIINKQRQSAFQVLSQALSSYFDTKYQSLEVESKYAEKLQTLTRMIASQTKNIIVLGQRCCKSTMISQALSTLQKQKIYLFGQTNETFFRSQTMQFLRSASNSAVFIYDANSVINQWKNLITSGYLLMEGKRVILQNQTIMELRDISGCSPSFVGECQIIYLGRQLVSNLEKFNKRFDNSNPNFSQLAAILKDLYGESMENINDYSLHLVIQYLKDIRQAIQQKSLHRLVVWILSLVDKQSLWTRHFGGKYTDFGINPYSYELASIDVSRCEQQAHPAFSSYIITPTKSCILLVDVINVFANSNIFVHISGPPQTGKTCLLQLLSRKLFLKFNQSPHDWGQQLKKIYCNVRRQRKNVLVDIQKQGHRIIIDDLDMSTSHHFQCLRVLIESSSFRDQYFNEYFIQKYQLISCSRELQKIGKYWSSVCSLSMKEFSKQSLQTIMRVNLAHQISQYNMNRQVQELINSSIIKSMLILQDDLSNIIGNSSSSSLLVSLTRNLLSLPKKQAYISAAEYSKFFKMHLYFKIHQKSENGKLKWQIQTVYQNLLKVIFGQTYQQSGQFYCNLEGQFQTRKTEDLQSLLLKIHPNLMCFNSLVKNVVYLVNQFSCMDRNIIILGRLGTGKKMLLRICGQLMNLNVIQNLSDAIIAALHNQPCILRNILQEDLTFYQQLHNCQSDKDLAKFVKIQKREQYYTRAAGQELGQDKILTKCKKLIIHAFIAEKKQNYQSFCQRRREIQNLPICLVEEWPPEAILSIYKIKDPYPNMHAEIFITINKTMLANNNSKFSLKMFEKYLRIYSEVFQKTNAEVQSKLELNSKIHFKFKQSCELIGIWESRVDILRTEIQQLIKKAKKTIMANQLFYFALSIFHKQIKQQEDKFLQETQQLKQMNEDIDRRMAMIKKVMSKIQKIVSSFQRTELSQLKKIYKQNRLIYFGVQCLCLLLGEEIDEKSINKILADPNLLMKMKDSQLLGHRNIKLESKVKKQFPSLQNELKNSSSELSKTLVEWIKGIIDYWQISEEYRIQHEKQIKASSNLQKSGQRYHQLSREVESINRSIVQKEAIIAQNQKIKKQQQFELNSIGQRLINAAKILPILTNQHQETKSTIQLLNTYNQNLRGNCILTAITATILALQPLRIKHIILNLTKNILRKNLVAFSDNFMAEISGRKINSLESLNYYLLTCNNLPKIIFDPRRKFINFIEKYAPLQMRDSIIENCEQLTNFQTGKLYHTSAEVKADKEGQLMVIDWGSVALEQKQTIFLRIAESKRPQYFQAKNQFELQISRNLKVLAKLKEELYSKICEREMKIIDDSQFIENSIELQKIKQNTLVLRAQAQQKILQIDHLTQQINEEVTQLIHVYQTLKHFRKIDLELMLYTYCKLGHVQHFFSWSLSNINAQNRDIFLILFIIRIKNQTLLELLKDIVHQNPLKQTETKLKKPQAVSLKNWETVVKLSNYSSNLKKLVENIQKYQKQFEHWCADPANYVLPSCLLVQNIEFIEYLGVIAYLKPKILSYSLPHLIQQYLPYSTNLLSNKLIVSQAHQKYPVIIEGQISWLTRLCKQQNEGRHKLQRASKINGEVQMKNIIWRSMEAKQWMILYDIQNAKTVQMIQNICYYVMNYDRQQGFKIFIVIDSLSSPLSITPQQTLVKSSVFLQSVSVYIYDQQITCNQLLLSNPVEYELTSENDSIVAGRQIFNRISKAVAICYTALVYKYPQLKKIEFSRIVSVLLYIKNKNISVQFNAFTIVQYLSRIMSFGAANSQIRSNIEQIWDLIVDENKIVEKSILGVPLNESSYDKFIRGNHALIGCEQSHFIRQSQLKLQPILQKIAKTCQLQSNKDQIFSFMRVQLAKLPITLTGTNSPNIFSFFYDKQVRLHNRNIQALKRVLQQLNEQNEREVYLEVSIESEYIKVSKILHQLTNIFKTKVSHINFKTTITQFINRLRKHHDFVLYFNHSLPILIVNPSIVSHLEAMISTYLVNKVKKEQIKDPYNFLPHLEFMNGHQEKDVHLAPGLYLNNLNSQQFCYNSQSKTLDPSFQVDGIEAAPIIGVKWRQSPLQQEKEQLQIEIFCRGQKILSIQSQIKSVYNEWSLRNPRLITQ